MPMGKRQESPKSRNTDEASKGRALFLPTVYNPQLPLRPSCLGAASQNDRAERSTQAALPDGLCTPEEASLPQDTPKAKAKGCSSDLVGRPESVQYLVRISWSQVRLEVHQAVGLCLQEAGYPLGSSVPTVPALDLQAVHSAGGGKSKEWPWALKIWTP